jgi:hypothetical protein
LLGRSQETTAGTFSESDRRGPEQDYEQQSFQASYRTVPVGLPIGAVGCVLVPLVLLPAAPVLPALVLPVPARSCIRHVSLSAPIMFWHRLRPPTAAGGEIAGVCDGDTAGAGCCVAMGGWPGEVLGAVEGVG